MDNLDNTTKIGHMRQRTKTSKTKQSKWENKKD